MFFCIIFSKANSELSNSLSALIPEAERSKELQETLNNFERSKRDLDNCLETMDKENERLNNEMKEVERDAENIAHKNSQLSLENRKLENKIVYLNEKLEESKISNKTQGR